MSRGVLAEKETAPAPRTRAAASSLRIGAPNDSFEQEADRMADAVMADRASSRPWSISRMSIDQPLQRKCSCGGSGSSAGGQCEECKEKEQEQKTVQRKATSHDKSDVAPPIVDEVLRSSGQPLDKATRDFFEPRFGHDFSKVRIHSDAQAAASARAVNALAYTVGHDVAMGSGQYAPGTERGRRLLAHELAHVVQRRVSPPANNGVVARACMSKEDCEKKKEMTPAQLMQKETSDPANKTKRDNRRAACTKKPPDASCTADGHGARAVETEKVLRDYDPARLQFIKQMVVDKDMEANFGALTGPCNGFMPPIPGGGICTFIPSHVETEAAEFNNTHEPKIAGRTRDGWRDRTLMILEHETEHARFGKAFSMTAPGPTACKLQDIWSSLTEIAAMLAEFPEVFRSVRENVSFTPARRQEILDNWFKGRITSERQSFKSTLHTIYCICECEDAKAYVTKTIEFTTANWSHDEKVRFHSELQDPKWANQDLKWPIQPPPAPPSPAPGVKP